MFFETFGTHYAVRAMMGAQILKEGVIKSEYLASKVAEETSYSGSASIPVKAVQVSPEFKISNAQSEENRSNKGFEDFRIINQFGATRLVSDMKEWDFETTNLESVEPVRVMLNAIPDLLRPQLFPVENEEEVRRLAALRETMNIHLLNYLNRQTWDYSPVPQAMSYVMHVNLDMIYPINRQDNEVLTDGITDIYGKVEIFVDGHKRSTPWEIKYENYETFKAEGYTGKPEAEVLLPVFPKYVKRGNRWEVTYPKHTVEFKWELYDADTGKDTTISKDSLKITLDEQYYRARLIQKDKRVSYSGAGTFDLWFKFQSKPVRVGDVTENPPDWFEF